MFLNPANMAMCELEWHLYPLSKILYRASALSFGWEFKPKFLSVFYNVSVTFYFLTQYANLFATFVGFTDCRASCDFEYIFDVLIVFSCIFIIVKYCYTVAV